MGNGPIRITFQGDRAFESALAALPAHLRASAIPAALRYAAAPIVAKARSIVPTDEFADPSGTLRASLGLILRKGRNGLHYVVFGARRGFARMVRREIRIGGAMGDVVGSSLRKADPANYAHLVEFGHHVVRPVAGTSRRKKTDQKAKSGRTFVPARPFLRPAAVLMRGQVRDRLIESLKNALTRYFARVNRQVFTSKAA